ncbi:MAG: flavin reductase family protein [Deltaproteobacteria bacterium]|nr:flavin reductase family protein [Deltaproteobacteria bacterium]
MKKILPQGLEPRDAYRLLLSAIAPRPIAFVSTVNKKGVPNAAPFCFFMGVTPSPPTIAFSVLRRGDQKKDTLRNLESTRDFVVNIVDEALAQAMNIASGSYPPDMSEFDVAGLTPTPSEIVTAPRIAESPVHLECKVRTILELGDLPAAIVVGEILCFHVHEEFVKDGIIDVRKLKPLGRAGENLYARFSDIFEMDMPA